MDGVNVGIMFIKFVAEGKWNQSNEENVSPFAVPEKPSFARIHGAQ